MKSILTKDQKIKTGWKPTKDKSITIQATIRYDDECNNGHNTFSITGNMKKSGLDWGGGCIHEEIAENFPEYSHLIKWHLVSSDGPMHYPGNVLYRAGDRDCWGKLKGEVRQTTLSLKFSGAPFNHKLPQKFITWIQSLGKNDLKCLVPIPESHLMGGKEYLKYTFQGYAVEWHKCPFDNIVEATEYAQAFKDLPFEVIEVPTAWGEGKERDLNAARSCAVWPDATDEQLMSDNLKDLLIERLPTLMEQFRKDIEALGFVY